MWRILQGIWKNADFLFFYDGLWHYDVRMDIGMVSSLRIRRSGVRIFPGAPSKIKGLAFTG